MFDFSFLQFIADHIKTYREFPLPVLLCDTGFQVYWSNQAAKNKAPPLTEVSGLRDVLKEQELEVLAHKIEAEGCAVLTDRIPYSPIRLSLSPLFEKDAMKGILLLLIDGTAFPGGPHGWDGASEFGVSASLSERLRSSVADIFSSMDAMAFKAEMVHSDWVKPHLNRIALQGYDILRVSSNLARFAELQESPLPDLASVDVFGWLRSLRGSVTAIGDELGIPIHFEIPEGESAVSLDVSLFQQALFNLLHNSLYYTRPGNEITLCAERDGEGVRLTVSDKGLGIPAEAQPHVFQPHFIFPHSGVIASLGLGLSIAGQVVHLHGGEIALKSQIGEGTSVTLTLPAPAFSQPISLGQKNDKHLVYDRFSPLYVGLISAKDSPHAAPGEQTETKEE